MKIKDMLKICVQNLLRRKSRTILTVLGVVVGCCAIVTMMSIGIGVQNAQEIMLQGMGDLTLIEIYGNGEKAKLDDEAIRKFQSIPNVAVALGKSRLNNIGFKMYAGDNNRYELRWANIIGISKEGMEKFGFELLEGSFPKEPFQILAGQYTAYNLMDTQRPEGSNMIDRYEYMYTYDPNTGNMTYNEDPELPDPYVKLCGSKMTMEYYSYEDYDKKYTQELMVTGVVKEDYNKDYCTSEGFIFMTNDLQSLQKKLFPTSTQKTSYDEIYVKVNDISQVAEAEEEIQKLGYSTYSMESIRKPLEEQARQQQMMLGGLGAISLFVAALGITNTMIMSISERTREIGVMKALGCYLGNIRAMFLFEAGSIGLIGGILGSIISYVISIVINIISSNRLEGVEITGIPQLWEIVTQAMDPANSPTSIIPLWLAGFAIVFSIFIGLGSGFYPANKAVHISALEAIKQE